MEIKFAKEWDDQPMEQKVADQIHFLRVKCKLSITESIEFASDRTHGLLADFWSAVVKALEEESAAKAAAIFERIEMSD